MVSTDDVIDIAGVLARAGFRFWLDGGWAVDALIGRQTRKHDDIDLVVLLEESDRIVSTFAEAGFDLIEDDRPTRFVLGDVRERRIDFHPIVFNEDGSARQIGAGPNGGDAVFTAGGFAGVGEIAGRKLSCISAELLLRFHTGYELQPKDRHNVRLLCEQFGLPLPRAYCRPRSRGKRRIG